MRVLIADDEREMTQALEAILKHEHYSVDIVYDGQAALDYGLAETYDCLVLDIMMPKLNGLQVLERLRENNISTPILLLTAKGQVEDRIEGLNCGADDYLPKPFDVGEFIARVRALTRRNGVFTSHILTVGNISLNRSTFELSRDEMAVRLGNKEFQMMELLMRQQGVLFLRSSLWNGSGAMRARVRSTSYGHIYLTCAESFPLWAPMLKLQPAADGATCWRWRKKND